jgi:alanine-synthesizing transaminase
VHKPIQISAALADVKYEIRGHLSARASELERQGYEIVSLNIGNPSLFGYRTPDPDVLHDVFHRIDEVLGQYA